MPKAARDLKSIPEEGCWQNHKKDKRNEGWVKGDVKRLTSFTPEYRLRYGDWRVLFEVEEDRIIIYRIMHRKDVYRLGG